MQLPDSGSIIRIRKIVLRWYARNKRDLPWRKTTDPYKILISEIMLQQTQVGRVEQKYPAFLRRFPTLRSLANASRADVIRAWQGMGYNNRAVRLQDLANTVVREYHGRIPSDTPTLLQLPGIGAYTAHAIACFSFERRVTVIDVNVRRVLSRLFQTMKTTDIVLAEDRILAIAEKILSRDASSWNQALMDLGSTICTARAPGCSRCPLMSHCKSSHLGKVTYRRHRTGTKREPMHAGIPNRLWRGRIVETLRSLEDHKAITLTRLGISIKQTFTHREMGWLVNLVRSLTDDGILTFNGKGNNQTVKLPDE